MWTLYFLCILGFSKSSHSEENIEENLGETRRILKGMRIFDTRPYMVYLRPTRTHNNQLDPNWVCGGVIIDERYILTSAACIEDINYFYVVSGTHRWVPASQTTECIENGALRAIWKCVPRTYRFDGNSFNNIRWMVNDIAVVMTEDPFDFTRRIKGCDFVPQKIRYNNISKDLEAPGTKGFIAGWGSTETFTDAFDDMTKIHVNSPYLMEATTILVQKSACKSQWDRRYHHFIDRYMICGRRITSYDMSGECGESHAACRQLLFPEIVGPRRRQFESDPDQLLRNSAAEVKMRERNMRNETRRQFHSQAYGGFCENDHGGPLLIGQGRTAMVLGIISAYRTKKLKKKCYGPFLYTSVYNNRFLVHCALHKELAGESCTTVLRDASSVLEEESFDWGSMPYRAVIYEDSDVQMVRRSDNVTTVDDKDNASPTSPDAGDERGITESSN